MIIFRRRFTVRDLHDRRDYAMRHLVVVEHDVAGTSIFSLLRRLRQSLPRVQIPRRQASPFWCRPDTEELTNDLLLTIRGHCPPFRPAAPASITTTIAPARGTFPHARLSGIHQLYAGWGFFGRRGTVSAASAQNIERHFPACVREDPEPSTSRRSHRGIGPFLDHLWPLTEQYRDRVAIGCGSSISVFMKKSNPISTSRRTHRLHLRIHGRTLDREFVMISSVFLSVIPQAASAVFPRSR